jgi:hypothetical protein
MKPIWNASVACLFACGWLSAAPPTCVTAALADYIALGAQGCTLNGDAYANFSYSAGASGGAATVTADQIIVTPLVVVPATSRFSFSAPWSVDQNQTQESVIRYTIVPPSGWTLPFQRQLMLGTAQIAGIIGRVTVNEITNVGNLTVFTHCTEVGQAQTNGSLANSDLADIVGIAHFPSILPDRGVIGIARLHAVCFSNPGGVAA